MREGRRGRGEGDGVLGAMIHVVSTAFAAPTRERCLASVASQRGCQFTHHYVEASTQDPPQDVITNQMSVIRSLPPDAIVALLDGDDWLAHPDALAAVAYLHEAGAWVTYGSFEYSDGRKGFAGELDTHQPVRAQAWKSTHLKTMRAGLFQRLLPADLAWPRGAPVPWDMVAMFAAIEMAGWERVAYCREVLYVYNLSTSNEWRNGPQGEIALAAQIRARPAYGRIEAL